MADTAYELLGNPLSDERRVSLWVTTDAGVIHRACGPQSTVAALGQRHVDAGICPRYELGECCESIEMACAFDVFAGVEDTDKVVILAVALARAEWQRLSWLDASHIGGIFAAGYGWLAREADRNGY